MLCVRRKKRSRLRKSRIKLLSSDGSAGTGGRSSIAKSGSRSRLGSIIPWRSSTEKGRQIDLDGSGLGGRDRASSSTDGGNPFLKSQYAFAKPSTMTSTYSPPGSADASVPLFSHPVSHAQQQPQGPQRRLSFIQESTTAPAYFFVSAPPTQTPPQPPLEQQRQQQLQQLRLLNGAPQYPPTNGPSNSPLEPETAPLMEPSPPDYRQQPQAQPLNQDQTSFNRPFETVRRADYKVTNLPPRGLGGGSKWSASEVSMASFSTTPTPDIIPAAQPHAQTSTGNAVFNIPEAPKNSGSPPPSFRTLDPPQAGTGTSTSAAPPPPTKPDNSTSKSPQSSSGKGMKGPRPRGGSNAQPAMASAVDERQGPQSGVGSSAGAGAVVWSLRPEDEDPESPVDPAVNVRSHWY
jgi:hypothetical protein